MQYNTIIFDLDGTLLNTLEDLADAVNYVLVHHGFPTRSLSEVRCFVGNGLGMLMKRALPDGTAEEVWKALFLELRTYYTDHCQVKTRPYEGIMELLGKLQADGVKMAVVSNKNDAAVRELSSFYFKDYINITIGEREGVGRKPKPDSVYEAIRLLNTSSAGTLYVGDSEVDKQTADNVPMDCVLVDWGFRDREKLQTTNPVAVISSPRELLDILNQETAKAGITW